MRRYSTILSHSIICGGSELRVSGLVSLSWQLHNSKLIWLGHHRHYHCDTLNFHFIRLGTESDKNTEACPIMTTELLGQVRGKGGNWLLKVTQTTPQDVRLNSVVMSTWGKWYQRHAAIILDKLIPWRALPSSCVLHCARASWNDKRRKREGTWILISRLPN